MRYDRREPNTFSPGTSDGSAKRYTQQAAGRIPVVAGTGSNSTTEAIKLTKHAQKDGADGCLVVAPYYNKPTQRGLIEHFVRIADVGLPIIVYNIPGRTGVDILPETLAHLAHYEIIVGIKEATGSVERVIQDILLCGEKLTYLSGDDPLTLPMISVGAHGVISVLSNLLPKEVVEMLDMARLCDYNTKLQRFLRLFPIMKAMFMETNPIPIKAAMAMMGLLEPVWRSPLVAPSVAARGAIQKEMRKLGLHFSGDCPTSG